MPTPRVEWPRSRVPAMLAGSSHLGPDGVPHPSNPGGRMTVVAAPAQAPAAHLSAEDIEAIGKELDAIRERVIESRGERDAAYIRRVIAVQRALELGGRAILLLSTRRSSWWIGTASLSLAKILENMEIGHN